MPGVVRFDEVTSTPLARSFYLWRWKNAEDSRYLYDEYVHLGNILRCQQHAGNHVGKGRQTPVKPALPTLLDTQWHEVGQAPGNDMQRAACQILDQPLRQTLLTQALLKRSIHPRAIRQDRHKRIATRVSCEIGSQSLSVRRQRPTVQKPHRRPSLRLRRVT